MGVHVLIAAAKPVAHTSLQWSTLAWIAGAVVIGLFLWAKRAQAAPAPGDPPSQAQQNSQPMNDVLRQLFNR